MTITEDLYVLSTTEAEKNILPEATCTLCGALINMKFREVHSSRCRN